MSNYHKLYTPQDSAIVFINHQPQTLFGVANTDRAPREFLISVSHSDRNSRSYPCGQNYE